MIRIFIYFFVWFLSIYTSYSQLYLGVNTFTGLSPKIDPHGVYSRPVLWPNFTCVYRWKKSSLVIEYNPCAISEIEYVDKVDRTCYMLIGIGRRSPLFTTYDSPDLIKMVLEASLLYKRIYQDYFIDLYSLNLQSGHRIGFSTKLLIEVDKKELYTCSVGLAHYRDFYKYGTSNRKSKLLWGYLGMCFNVNINTRFIYDSIKERFKRNDRR